jgi:tRNA A-37 threonylcarbamoyl transferase component Bud32
MHSDHYVKKNVSFHEYYMYNLAYNLSSKTTIFNIPKVIEYDSVNKMLIMEKINSDNISNVYGESINKVPSEIVKKIRKTIEFLRDNGIVYPDITGYNFILCENKLWIIDFEHSYFDGFENRNYEFIDLFIKGKSTWNPDFQ